MFIARFYRRFRVFIEQIRISRLQISEGSENQLIAVELIRLRRVFIATLLVLVFATLTVDNLTGEAVADWIESRASVESHSTVRSFAGIVAASMAAITAILISISLVVLQNAGQRFGSRLTRYLLNSERVSRYVLDLLVLTLLFSLWSLLASAALKHPPYASTAVLLFLATLSIVSLVIYRSHALAMLDPGEAIRQLEREITRALSRIPERPSNGRGTISGYLRDTVGARLADLEDLGNAVLELRDEDGIEATVDVYLRIVVRYTGMKKRISESSSWFPTRYQAIDPNNRSLYIDQRALFDRFGGGRPVQEVRDHIWLESICFQNALRLLKASIDKGLTKPLSSNIATLELVISHLFDVQQKPALERALEFQSWLTGIQDDQSEYTGIVLNLLGGTARHIIGSKRADEWINRSSDPNFAKLREQDIWAMEAPLEFEEVLLTTRERIGLELVIERGVVTPQTWLRKEVSQELNQVEHDFKSLVFAAAMTNLIQLSDQRRRDGSEYETGAVYVLVLMWHRCLVEHESELLVCLPEGYMRNIGEAVLSNHSDNEWINPLLDEMTSCAFLSLIYERYGDVAPLLKLLAGSAAIGQESPTEFLEAYHRLIGVCSFALLISELRSHPALLSDTINAVSTLLEDDPDRWRTLKELWEATTDPQLAFIYGLQEDVGVKYHHYFATAWEELHEFPEVPVSEDAPWAMILDHPSEFIKHNSRHGTISASSCSREFLRRLMQGAPPNFSKAKDGCE